MIADLITRIQTTVPALKAVGGAAGFQSAAESNPRVTPCAFVIPLADDPQPSAAADVVIQRVAAKVGVIFVVRNLTDVKGVAAKEDLDTLRNAVKAQLLGWRAQPEFDPFERGPGSLLAFRDGHMWWQDIYTTSYYERSVI